MTYKETSPLLHYVKGNTSRFGSAIHVLPSDIREYFKLSFIIAVVVFIFLFCFQKLLYVMYFTFVIQKMSFSIVVEFVRNKVLLLLAFKESLFALTHSLLTFLFNCLGDFSTTKHLYRQEIDEQNCFEQQDGDHLRK